MKHARRFGLAAILASSFLFAPPVTAQLKKAPSPVGSWSFQTEKMGYGCALGGEMTITQTADKAFKCTFKAVWSCDLRLPKAVHTEQSCIATQTGYDLTVTSHLDKIAKVDPVEMMQLMRERYAADHFSVKINWAGDKMDGMFKSYGQAPVIFRKQAELVG